MKRFQKIKISNIQYPISLYLLISLSFIFLFFVSPVLADPPTLGEEIGQQMNAAGGASGLSEKDPRLIIARFINIFLGVLAMLFIAYVVYAGFLYMTAGGEEEKTTTAKKHIWNAIIGLIIILSALSISLLVTTYLIRATSYQYYQPPLPYPTL